MRTLCAISLAFASLALAGGGTAASAGEPFLIQNEHPVGRLYGLPAGGDAVPAASAGWQARAALDLANNSYDRIRGADELVIDGETWCARIELRRGWKNGWRVALQVPVVSHQGGGTDEFIENYHDAMGLTQGNREWKPPGQLEYRYRRGGETLFRLTDSTTGLGDVRGFVAAPLWRDGTGSRAVDAVAGVELPTGDPDRLLGSGSTDVSLGLAARDAASLARWNLELHGSAGVLAMTKGEILEDFQEPLAGYGTVSVGWQMLDWLQPRLQVDVHSPFFSGTRMTPLDDWAVELVSGATVRLPAGLELDIAVAEDVAVNTAPDVVAHVSIKRSL